MLNFWTVEPLFFGGRSTRLPRKMLFFDTCTPKGEMEIYKLYKIAQGTPGQNRRRDLTRSEKNSIIDPLAGQNRSLAGLAQSVERLIRNHEVAGCP